MESIRSVYDKLIKRKSTDTLSSENDNVKIELIVYQQLRLVHIYIEKKTSPREFKTLDITPNGEVGMHADLYNYNTCKTQRFIGRTKITGILSDEEATLLKRIVGGVKK